MRIYWIFNAQQYTKNPAGLINYSFAKKGSVARNTVNIRLIYTSQLPY